MTGIAITTPPNKTEYDIGESLDLTGLKVTASFNDLTTSVVSINDSNVNGFDSSTEGVKTLIVTYGGKTATFDVTVTKTLTGIVITTPPDKIEYDVGETLDLTGLVVMAVYSDGSTSVVNVNDSDVSGFDSTAEDVITLTVTYNGKTAAFDVTIVDV
jgi:hypothetical protein